MEEAIVLKEAKRRRFLHCSSFTGNDDSLMKRKQNQTHEATDLKEAKRRRLLPGPSFTGDNDSLMKSKQNQMEEATDLKEAKHRSLLPCSSFTCDVDSLTKRKQNQMEEAADLKEAERRRLPPCSYFTGDDSLMETLDSVHVENEIVEKSVRVEDSGSEQIDPRVDADIQKMVHLIEKQKPVPPLYDNISRQGDGNASIRFDSLMPDAELFHLIQMIPPTLQLFVTDYCGVFCDGLNGKYGFVTFSYHEIAKKFLQSFNGKTFHNPDITYQLSWAPFTSFYKCENVDVYEETTISESDTEAKTKLDTNSDSDSGAYSDSELEDDSNSESDSECEDDSNSESVTDSGTTGFHSESVQGIEDEQEIEDEQFLSREETAEEPVACDAKKMEEYKKYEEFYIRLDKEFHERKESWPCPLPRPLPEVEKCSWSRHASTILVLDDVDPLVQQKHMECIFRKYGLCSVNLPHGKGMGYVEFVERESAIQAYKKLYFVMPRLRICYLSWGYKPSRYQLVGGSKEDGPVGGSKEDEPVGGSKEDEPVDDESDENLSDCSLSDCKPTYQVLSDNKILVFLCCPLLGEKCQYPG